MSDVFHQGELAVQDRAGVVMQARKVGQIISSDLPEGADRYLASLPILFRGGADERGDVWASVLTGGQGFARVVDSHTVEIRADSVRSDPLERVDEGSMPAGFLAIDLATRQRFRFNGRAQRVGDTLRVHVEQAYGNCPKYIQLRKVTVHTDPPEVGPVDTGSQLSDGDADLIQRADTFFIASMAQGRGADVSHRGGQPGFARVTPDGDIAFRDYPGNNMFQTLGNLTADPRAGLLFIDFDTGTTLQLSGRAKVIWAETNPDDLADTGRSVTFRPQRVVRTGQAVPLRWVLKSYSPYNPDEK